MFIKYKILRVKVFVHLFQKVAVSKDSVFVRPPQRAEYLYRQALFGEFENLSARGKVLKQAEPAPSSRCRLRVSSHLKALAAGQDENFIIFKRERTEDARPARERQAANLHLANNANWVQAQLAAKMYSAAILMIRQRAGMRTPYWR